MTQYVLEILYHITENNSSGYILNYQWVVYGSENDTLFEYNSSDSIQPLLPFLPQGLNDTTYIIFKQQAIAVVVIRIMIHY